MEIRQLRAFAALARILNFHSAARELGYSQGALSQIIAQLEKDLDVPLFERGEGVLRLSQAGERLKVDAVAVLDAEASAGRAVEAIRTAKAGALRIGFSPSHRALAEAAILELLGDTVLPNLSVLTEEVEGAVLEQHILEGYVDVGLTFMQGDALPAGLTYERKKKVPLSVVVSESHPWAGKKGVNVKELSAMAPSLALLRPGLRIRNKVDEYFVKHKVRPKVVLETNVVQTLLAVVRKRNDVVAVTAAPEAASTTHGVSVVSLEPRPVQPLTTGILWRAARKSRRRGGSEAEALKTAITERFERAVLTIRDATTP